MPSWQVFDGLLLQLMINGWRRIPQVVSMQFFSFLNNLQNFVHAHRPPAAGVMLMFFLNNCANFSGQATDIA